MIQSKALSGTGRGLALVGGVTVMGMSLALAQFTAQSQAQTRQPERAPAAAQPDAEQPNERQPNARQPGARRPGQRQPDERQPDERQPRARQAGERQSGEQGRPARPQGLGFKVEGEGDAGLTVASVESDGVAADAGLRTSDKIVSVDGRPIRNGRSLMAYLRGQDGRRVPLVIEREGRQMTVQFATAPAGNDGAWLGVFLEQGEKDTKGARITHVYPAGPAARAGLRSGDVVLAVNGEDCEECSGFIEALENLKAGEKVQLLIQRKDQQLKLDAMLSNRNQFVFNGPRELEAGEGEQWADQHEHDDFYDIPEHAMELEAHRRLAEQHERIENLIQQLRGEVQALREELKTRR